MNAGHPENQTQVAADAPLVSVLMAVYNGVRYLRAAIESVLAQDFERFELVIVDDCSTDETPQIIASYGDPRIVYLRNAQNLGQTPSLNVAFRHAGAELVCRIDGDDLFLPGKLRRQYEFMNAHPEVAVCGTAAVRIDEEGGEVGVNRLPSDPTEIRFRALRTVPVVHVSVIMRKSVIQANGGYPERYRYAADFALWSTLLRDGHVITNVPDVLTQYREFGESFGAAQKVGAAGEESAEIIASNARAFTGIELTPAQARGIALLYFPAAGADPVELCEAHLTLRRLARAVYVRPPRRVLRTLSGALFWALTKRLAYARRRDAAGETRLGAALRKYGRDPIVLAILLAAAAVAPLGEDRIVRLKDFMLLRVARDATRMVAQRGAQ